MCVRDFTFGDEAALQAVFYSAIHTIAASDYARVPSTTKGGRAFCATFCARRLHRIASPSCLTTASG
jgi:hypothetical protein